jgi:hypothetical protein
MTEDDIGRGLTPVSMVSGNAYEPVPNPSHVESVITSLPTGGDGAAEVWKLNHYYERLDEFDRAHGLSQNPFAPPPAEPAWELHNLTADPEERRNRATTAPDVVRSLQGVLNEQREAKRRLPQLRNPST